MSWAMTTVFAAASYVNESIPNSRGMNGATDNTRLRVFGPGIPVNATPADERKMLLAFASQPIDVGSTYTTGGDVSRFQRRSVPARPRAESGSNNSSDFSKFAEALVGRGTASQTSAPAATVVTTGPVVRVSRGNNVTVVPVGAR